MKKFLSLVLALAMVLAIAAPAMAISGVKKGEEDSDSASGGDITLDLAIVEERDAGFSGSGYVDITSKTFTKNERVFIGVFVETPEDPDINSRFFDGSSLSVETTNITMTRMYDGAGTIDDDDEATLAYTVAPDTDATFIIDGFISKNENGTVTATLKGGLYAGDEEMEEETVYNVYKNIDSDEITYRMVKDGKYYTVEKVSGKYALQFKVNDDDECIEIVLIENYGTDSAKSYTIRSDYNNELCFAPTNGDDDIKAGDDDYYTLNNHFNVIMDYMGFKLGAGGELFDDLFLNKLCYLKIVKTINVNVYNAGTTPGGTTGELPPKTGDAASTLGFVMIAVAIVAAAAVAYKKVRA